MVRHFVCKYEKVQGQRVRAALDWIDQDPINHSQRKAAVLFNITRSVLQRWTKRRPDIPETLSQGSFKPVFTPEQEIVILDFIFELADKFYAMTRRSLAELAFHLAEANGLQHKFHDGVAGPDWIASFLLRHKDTLSPRTGTPLSLIRIQSFTKRHVYRLFDLLEKLIHENGFTADKIYNVDETGLSVVASKPPARLARKGVRSVDVLVAVERGRLVTMTCAASASGHYIPPMFIMPSNSHYVDRESAPIGSLFVKSVKGWTSSQNFVKWLEHFRANLLLECGTKVLLILDNHSSHICYEAVKYCSRNSIELLTLPPHTTHKTQPLDVSFFSPLKAKYGQVLTSWLAKHPYRKPRTEDIPAIMKQAYEDAAKESNAISGFAKTGIFLASKGGPDRFVFSDSEFAQDSEENIPLNQDGNFENHDADDDGDGGTVEGEEPVHMVTPPNASEGREGSTIFSVNETQNNTQVHEELDTSITIANNNNQFASSGCTHVPVITFGNPPTLESDVQVTRDLECFWKHPLVNYSSSSNSTTSSSSEDEQDYLPNRNQQTLNENIFMGENEVIPESQELEALLVTNSELPRAVDKSVFDVSPWELVNNPTTEEEAGSSRKKREPQKAEIMTSQENLDKLEEKEKVKRKKNASTDSDERRVTREYSKTQKRTLRGGKSN